MVQKKQLFTCIYIFYRKKHAKLLEREILQPGSELIAGGYAFYGSSTALVFSIKYLNEVVGFTLDPV